MFLADFAAPVACFAIVLAQESERATSKGATSRPLWRARDAVVALRRSIADLAAIAPARLRQRLAALPRRGQFLVKGQKKGSPAMASCDDPISTLRIGDAVNCAWEKGADAVSMVLRQPGSSSINDWALTLLAAIVLLNVLFLILRLLLPRPFA
jgi:hypothetical protein